MDQVLTKVDCVLKPHVGKIDLISIAWSYKYILQKAL